MENFRKFGKSWTGRFAMLLFLAPMAFLGMNTPSGRVQGDVAAKVGKIDITETEIDSELSKRRNQLIKSGVDSKEIDEDQLREQVLTSLINDSLLQQQAASLGIGISDANITKILKEYSVFADENGKFSNDKFALIMRQNGLSKQQLFELERKGLIVQQLSNGIVGTSVYPMKQVDKIIDLELETRNLWIHRVAWQDFIKDISINDEDIKAYYDEHTDKFKSIPVVDLSYLKLSASDVQLSETDISDDDIAKQYEAFLAENNYGDMREFSQILLTGDDAESRANAIKARIDAGEEFTALAKELSDDDTGKQGGAIGKFDPAMFGDDGEYMQKQLAELKLDEVSSPIKNSYGYQIFKVTADNTPDIPTLESVKDELMAKALEYAASVKFADKITAINDMATNGFAIDDIAKQEGLTVNKIDDYKQYGNVSVLAQPLVLKAAFNEFNLQDMSVSAGIELEEGDNKSTVWIQSNNYRPVKQLTMAEAKADITMVLQQQKATDLAVEFAKEKAKDVTAKDSIEGMELEFAVLENATRKHPALTKNERLIAFSQKVDGESEVVSVVTDTENGASLIVADKIRSAEQTDLPIEQRKMLANQIRNNLGQNDLMDYIEYLNTSIGVELKEDKEKPAQ